MSVEFTETKNEIRDAKQWVRHGNEEQNMKSARSHGTKLARRQGVQTRGKAVSHALIRGVAIAVALLWVALQPVSAEDKFTMAILPDVQLETDDSRLQDRLQWLVQNRTNLNLKIVLQCGDMMNFNDDRQYAHQSEAMKVLDEAGIPYVTTLGNHDTAAVKVDGGSAAPGNVNTNLRNTTKYNSYFPLQRFKALAGTYEEGKIDNAYHTFTAGGLNWLILNLELWPRSSAVAWAKQVVKDHPDYNVVIVTHAYLNGDSTIQQDNGGYGDNSPQYLFDQLVSQYPNVRLVFSGHTGSYGYRTDQGVSGNTIYEFLQCYHDKTDNPVRLLEVDTQHGTLGTRVYGPLSGQDKSDGSTRTVTDVAWVGASQGR